jgi:hypothetical protein
MSEPTEPTDDVFDLDALEREGTATAQKPPFPFKIGGQLYHLVNAEELDYRDLIASYRSASAGDFELAMRLLLPEDERDSFFEHEIPAWRLEKLFDQYTKHFGLASRGKSRSSSRR